MKQFYIIPNNDKEMVMTMTQLIMDYLSERGCEVVLHPSYQEDFDRELPIDEDLLDGIDCAIVLGGDGTIIHSARMLAKHHIPILGVNLGSLGFLAAIEEHCILKALDAILSDDYQVESRMMLEALVYENGELKDSGFALNDVVVSRMALSRMVGYSLYINERFVNDYSADGLIVATPTGSTAYNLSAGGPILEPQTEMLVITPICSHSLSARSIVISSQDVIRITFERNRRAWDNDLMVTIDGQTGVQIINERELVIRKSALVTQMVVLKDYNFYSILRHKLSKN